MRDTIDHWGADGPGRRGGGGGRRWLASTSRSRRPRHFGAPLGYERRTQQSRWSPPPRPPMPLRREVFCWPRDAKPPACCRRPLQFCIYYLPCSIFDAFAVLPTHPLSSPFCPSAAAPIDWDAPTTGPPPRPPPTQNAAGGRAGTQGARAPPTNRPDRPKLSSILGAARISRSTDRECAAKANGVFLPAVPHGWRRERRHLVNRGVRTATGRAVVTQWTRGGGSLGRQRALRRHSHGQGPCSR